MWNSTIVNKKKLLSCGHIDYNFSRGRCKSCATIQSVASRQEKEIEKEGISSLISELDAILSKVVRLSSLNAKGEAVCYTCGATGTVAQMQCGHFISRGCMFLRFDTSRNLRCQCENCNCFLNGNIKEFRKRLEKELPSVTSILEEESRLVYKYSRDELRALINEYSQKLIELKKIKNV
jgi:hypothetical protein